MEREREGKKIERKREKEEVTCKTVCNVIHP